jgi:hypothetical protein
MDRSEKQQKFSKPERHGGKNSFVHIGFIFNEIIGFATLT